MSLTREQQIAALEKTGLKTPLEGVKRGYSAADVVRLRGSLQPDYTLAQRGARTLWDKVNGGAKKGYVNAFGAITGRSGHATGQGRPGSRVSVRLAGRRRRQHLRNHVPGPVAVRLRLRPDHGSPHQQHLQACRRNPVVPWHQPGRRRLHRLLPADRCRRGSRFRRRAERLRTDEEHDRRRCRGCSLRRPAGCRQEVWPHGRQGARPDP